MLFCKYKSRKIQKEYYNKGVPQDNRKAVILRHFNVKLVLFLKKRNEYKIYFLPKNMLILICINCLKRKNGKKPHLH